ncbi:hypothetical protein [Diatraea saccharalis granulovirus]|uniref:Uncharacterized protein n=1 Tax=Diatraea saccharalis granulovirus TaxID=1675862 RepID=A0A0R7EZ06_9BBAC|nr:hypothetical protein [Diatraea saccharalis granulovirus]AKN80810.1 hypothetical protein [Diatraea saccharalis granulovirus]
MRRYYFMDIHPITIINLGNDDYCFKLKNLAECFNVRTARVQKELRKNFIIKFCDLSPILRRKYTMYPTTLLLRMSGLDSFLSRFCSEPLKVSFLKFINECLNFENEDNTVEYDQKEATYGVLPTNVEYIMIDDNVYYKSSDIVRLIRCSRSYTLNKYVENENMFTWRDLKRYLCNKFVWSNFDNRWKDNTIFLTDDGVRELTMAMGAGDLYDQMIKDIDNHENVFRKYIPPVTRKQQERDDTICGLHFVVTPDLKVFFKLNQITKRYSLRVRDMEFYRDFLVSWNDIKSHDRNWRGELILVSDQGVYKMLTDAKLNSDAKEFMYSIVYEARTTAKFLKKFDSKV